jgi:hypothetical protein
MQDIDRIAHVEALAEPGRRGGVAMQAEARRPVSLPEPSNGIPGKRWRRWHCRQRSSVRAEEPQRGRPALGPVLEVMTLPEPHAAPRELAAALAMLQRAP